MSQDINNVVLIGRLVRDAELKYTNIGTPVTKFAIAVNERRKNGDSWENRASFIDVTLWGKLGESLHDYMTKGKQIAVQGRLNQQRWEKDGYKHSRTGVVAENIQLLGSKSGGTAPPEQNQESSGNAGENFDDDIPFF